MTPAQAQDYLVRRIEDEGPDIDLERVVDEVERLEYEARGLCEACGEGCDYPPVCRDCAADVESAKAYREGRDE